MSKKFILAIAFILLALPLVSGITYQQGTEQDLKYPCINNGTYCADTARCNITIFNPANNVTIDNDNMTNSGAWHNYTLNTTQTEAIGFYQVQMICDDAGTLGYSTFEFEVTRNGMDLKNADFLPLIVALLGLIIILLIIAVMLHEDHTLLSLLFIGIGFYMLIPLLQTANMAVQNNFFDAGITDMVGSITSIFIWLDYIVVIYLIVYIFVKTLSGYNQDKKAKMEGLR